MVVDEAVEFVYVEHIAGLFADSLIDLLEERQIEVVMPTKKIVSGSGPSTRIFTRVASKWNRSTGAASLTATGHIPRAR